MREFATQIVCVCLSVCLQARVCVCILVHAAGALALHSSVLYLAGSQIKFRDMTLQRTQCVAGVQQQQRQQQQQQQHGLNMATVFAWMLRPLEMHLALLLLPLLQMLLVDIDIG